MSRQHGPVRKALLPVSATLVPLFPSFYSSRVGPGLLMLHVLPCHPELRLLFLYSVLGFYALTCMKGKLTFVFMDCDINGYVTSISMTLDILVRFIFVF